THRHLRYQHRRMRCHSSTPEQRWKSHLTTREASGRIRSQPCVPPLSCLGVTPHVKVVEPTKTAQPPPRKPEQPLKYCLFCNNIQHYFNQCTAFRELSRDQKVSWIKTGKRCSATSRPDVRPAI